jgi:serine/threonine protein kinase
VSFYSSVSGGAALGEGTFGFVTEATDPVSGRRVVLKKIKADGDSSGFPICALREIKLLKVCPCHISIVELIEVVTQRPSESNRMLGEVYIVFEYVDGDLAGLLTYPGLIRTQGQVKSYLYQLLQGVAHLHASGIIHRDLKPANIMLSRNHQIKIADFGLAKRWKTNLPTTPGMKVVTAWYRAPEIFLGDPKAGSAIDLWSIGIIFIELMLGEPPFQKGSDPEIIQDLWALCGSPTNEHWPTAEALPGWSIARPRKTYARNISGKYSKHISKTGLDLLDKLLTLNPDQRITAEDALKHPFFSEGIPDKETLPIISAEKFHYAGAKSALDKLRKSRPLYVHVRAAVPDADVASSSESMMASSSSAPIGSISNIGLSEQTLNVSLGESGPLRVGIKRPRQSDEGIGEESNLSSNAVRSSILPLSSEKKMAMESNKIVERGGQLLGGRTTSSSILAFVRPVSLMVGKSNSHKEVEREKDKTFDSGEDSQ